MCQIQMRIRRHLSQTAHWKCLRLIQELDKGGHGAKHLRSAEDLVVSLLREQAGQFEIAVGVGRSYRTRRQ